MPLCPPFPHSRGSPTFLGPPGGNQEPLPVLTHPLPVPSALLEWQLLSPALFLPSWQRAQIFKEMPSQPSSRFCARQTIFWGPHSLASLASILKGLLHATDGYSSDSSLHTTGVGEPSGYPVTSPADHGALVPTAAHSQASRGRIPRSI